MSLVQVLILKTTVTHAYGTLPEGARLSTSEDFAEHLVKDCGAAEYIHPADSVANTVTVVEDEIVIKPDVVVVVKPKSQGRKSNPASNVGDGEAEAGPVDATVDGGDQAAVATASDAAAAPVSAEPQ
jgi:hypothetical protein